MGVKKETLLPLILCAVVIVGITYLSLGRQSEPRIKNIILVIGDGMGPQQLSLALLYARYAPNSVVPDRKLNLEKLIENGEVGLMTTEPYENLVTDSAASATHMATGVKTRVEMVGLDPDGKPVPTLLEQAKGAGKATGLVSNTRMTHATPAAFAAHQVHRKLENEIVMDLLETAPDVMLSGGLRHWLAADHHDSKRKDRREPLKEAEKLGYQIVSTKEELKNAGTGKILGLFSLSLMPDALTLRYPIPTLKEMTGKALEILSKNKNGFFLMVEGGLIDYAGHYNDVGMLLHEMLALDETVGVIHDWAKKRDDTLVIVTADHETGSFGFSYSKTRIPEPKRLPSKDLWHKPSFNFGDPAILDRLYDQKKTFVGMLEEFDALSPKERSPVRLKSLIEENVPFKLTLEDAKRILTVERNEYRVKDHPYLSDETTPRICDFKEFYVYSAENRAALIARALASQQQIVWGSGNHTSTPVAVIAYGPKSVLQKFDGLYHATDLGRKLLALQNKK